MTARTTTLLFVGVLLGGILALATTRSGLIGTPSRPAPVRDIVDVATMEYSAASEHRVSHFAQLQSIEALQALPSEFDRAEALYALGGRANSEELEVLAYDALRIADDIWRERALSIVFFRLAEFAPEAALELATSADFSEFANIEKRVWRTWARLDLVAATTAASALEPPNSHRAMQSIYGAIGGAYTEAARAAENLSGIGPDIRNRTLFLRGLINESPSAALAHIMQLDSPGEQRAQVRYLARTLASDDAELAEQFAGRIDDDALRKAYLDRVFEELAEDQPQLAFIKLFENRSDKPLSSKETDGIRDLAKTRLDDALKILERISDPETQQGIASAIAANYASQRPDEALNWAKAYGGEGINALLQLVILEVAKSKPELALREAQQTDESRGRYQLVSNIISSVAKESPGAAVLHLGLIEDKTLRANAATGLMDEWLKNDAQAAINWALSSEDEIKDKVFGGRSARHMDLDTALNLVPTLPEEHRRVWARSVARELVEKRSAEDAFYFVEQFKGSSDYEMQMAHLIGQVSDVAPDLAMQWSDKLPAGNARDAAISNAISTIARSAPSDAAAMLDRIDDMDLRQVAASQVLSRWQRKDPDAVEQWIQGMPRGADRDSIIMNTAMNSQRDSEETIQLLNTIDDEGKRQEAILLHSLMRSRDDPEKMMQQLEQLDMPEFMRQQLKAEIMRSAARGQ